MHRSMLVSTALFFLCQTAAHAQQELHFSGQSACESDFRHTYMVSKIGSGFDLILDNGMSRYQIFTFEEPLGSKTHTFGGAQFEVSPFNDASVTLKWIKGSCRGESVLMARPADPVEAYNQTMDFAQESDITARNAVILSDMAYNLPPSSLLPRLDQATLPQSVNSAVNTFFGTYLNAASEAIQMMQVDSQQDADAVTSKVAETFDPRLGFDLNLFADSSLQKWYLDTMKSTGLRIVSAGYTIKPMTILEDGRFCDLVQNTTFNRADRFEPLFGLPFGHWDRAFTEAAMVRLESCGGQWGPVKADRLAEFYPNIVKAAEAVTKTVEQERQDAAYISAVSEEIEIINALPNDLDTYISTQAYQLVGQVEQPRQIGAEARHVLITLQRLQREREAQAEPIVLDYLKTRFAFTEDQFMSDDWQAEKSFEDRRCLTPELPETRSYAVQRAIDEACLIAISAATKIRSEQICEVIKAELGYDQKTLDTRLLIGTGKDLFDVQDSTLGQLICAFTGRTNFAWSKQRGLFSSGYVLVATAITEPQQVTTVTFMPSEDGNGMVPQEVTHSIGGDLSSLAPGDRMLCVLSPVRPWCDMKR